MGNKDDDDDNYLNWKNLFEEMIPKLSGAYHTLGQWFILVILTLSNQFTMHNRDLSTPINRLAVLWGSSLAFFPTWLIFYN